MEPSALREQLQKALVAHGAWKVRLQLAIESGAADVTPDTVRLDNRCEFGRWLYGDVDSQTRATPNWARIRDLHAAFHIAAADVLKLAVSGRKADALNAMSLEGDFRHASNQLTIAISQWSNSTE
jgi:hypothetical protein